MSASNYLVPEPDAGPDTQPYWDGLRDGRFLVQKCRGCGKRRHYPRPLCDRCHSFDTEWVSVEGRGTVHSWTVCHHAFLPAFKDRVPYLMVIADIDGDVRVNLQLESASHQPLKIGDAVRIEYRTVNERLTLPVLVREAADA
ncbi:Zn-ribbon domain-containing OB-fold protein [Ramlibacter sp. AN1015]|uniref:Zn-ribbon domain-containing OB-fold protein n=1 Tax=Ramlibacter sp. AN1015 TaxID=3133428 RepID=UPI0030BFD754